MGPPLTTGRLAPVVEFLVTGMPKCEFNPDPRNLYVICITDPLRLKRKPWAPAPGLQSGAMKIFHRSHLILLLAAVTAAGFLINSLHAATQPSAQASTKEDLAVLAPITAMFDGMAKRDAAAIKKPLLPGGGLVLMRDGKPTQMTFDAFAEAVGKPGKAQIEERIHDPLVRIDNDLAVVWAPFEFLVDGKVDHCGTDLFNLVRTDGKWLIASVADTGRKDCGVK